MTKPKKTLEALMAQLPPAVVEEATREAARQRPAVLALMALQDLRQRRGITQEALARALGVKQAAISRLERRPDMYLSTLGELVAALGGELRVIARFPEGDVPLDRPPGSADAGHG